MDIADENPEQLGIVLQELPDISPPVLVRVYAYLGLGYIHLFLTKQLIWAKLNMSAMFLNNNPGDHFLDLSQHGVPFDDDINADRKCVGSSNGLAANPYTEDADGTICKANDGQYLSTDVIVNGPSINILSQRLSVYQ